MSQNKTGVELAVGTFVLVCLLCVGYLTIKLGKMELVGGDAYEVSAKFTSVSGLRVGSSVEMAGVPIGRVRAIGIDKQDMQALVVLQINKGVELSDDSIASIKTSGLIGDKYVGIV